MCVFVCVSMAVWFSVSPILKLSAESGFVLSTCGRSRAHGAALLFGRVNDLRQIFKPKVRASRLGGESGDNWCVISF